MPILAEQIADALARFERDGNLGVLLDALRMVARDADIDELIAAAEPYRDRLEVVIPLYERIVAARPEDAKAMVVLANAYWLSGRGTDAVAELSERAKRVDPSNRAAWHLWALAEPEIRARMERWSRVTAQFPADQLARAALADNATSLAGAEHDLVALGLAIRLYEGLLAEASVPAQRRALEETLATLRGWKF